MGYTMGMYPQGRPVRPQLHPKFSDTLTLFQPRGTDSAYHRRGRTYIFPVVMSLSQRKKVDGTNKTIYRISANSFRGNYSFLKNGVSTVV